MAVRRQAPKLSPEDYEVYVEDLMEFPLEDVESVCKKIGMTAREEGETAFPTCATLMKPLKRLEYQRRDAIRQAQELKEYEEARIRWEQEKSEDEAKGIKRGTPEEELKEIIQGAISKRTMPV